MRLCLVLGINRCLMLKKQLKDAQIYKKNIRQMFYFNLYKILLCYNKLIYYRFLTIKKQ